MCGKDSKIVEIRNSTPQGRVISPVLFNITINYIFSNVVSGFCLSSFADDEDIWKRVRNTDFRELQLLERVKVFKFLGVWFDKRLT